MLPSNFEICVHFFFCFLRTHFNLKQHFNSGETNFNKTISDYYFVFYEVWIVYYPFKSRDFNTNSFFSEKYYDTLRAKKTFDTWFAQSKVSRKQIKYSHVDCHIISTRFVKEIFRENEDFNLKCETFRRKRMSGFWHLPVIFKDFSRKRKLWSLSSNLLSRIYWACELFSEFFLLKSE